VRRKFSNGDGPARCYKRRTVDTAMSDLCMLSMWLQLLEVKSFVFIALYVRRLVRDRYGVYTDCGRTSTASDFTSRSSAYAPSTSSVRHAYLDCLRLPSVVTPLTPCYCQSATIID